MPSGGNSGSISRQTTRGEETPTRLSMPIFTWPHSKQRGRQCSHCVPLKKSETTRSTSWNRTWTGWRRRSPAGGNGPRHRNPARALLNALGARDAMRLYPPAIASLFLIATGCMQESQMSGRLPPDRVPLAPTREDVRAVSPALERYRQETVEGELWKRPGLSPRDRSIVTLAALVARNQVAEMPRWISFALDQGVKPSEV